MAGFVILLLTAIGTGIAAVSILGHPGLLWQILASVSVLNALATIVVVLRRTWGRRVALILLGAQIVGAVTALVVVAIVEIRDLPDWGMAVSLVVFIFIPIVAAILAVSLLAALSINSLRWPDR